MYEGELYESRGPVTPNRGDIRLAEHASLNVMLKTLLQMQIEAGRVTLDQLRQDMGLIMKDRVVDGAIKSLANRDKLDISRDAMVTGTTNARVTAASMFHNPEGRQ